MESVSLQQVLRQRLEVLAQGLARVQETPNHIIALIPLMRKEFKLGSRSGTMWS